MLLFVFHALHELAETLLAADVFKEVVFLGQHRVIDESSVMSIVFSRK